MPVISCSGPKAIDQLDAASRGAFHENVGVRRLTPCWLNDCGARGLRSWSVTVSVPAALGDIGTDLHTLIC
jgi:hypothetical protein